MKSAQPFGIGAFAAATIAFFSSTATKRLRLIGEVFDPRGNDGPAMDAGQRAVLAEIVQILADGLRGHFEAAGEVFNYDPARGTGDVEDFGFAMGQSGHERHLSRMLAKANGALGARSTQDIGLVAAPYRCLKPAPRQMQM